MPKRSYEQYCPLACTLDLLGERWTLLIVRDLIAGPKRYTDLRRGLPGVATDLLTERLRTLEGAGLVARRELPPPAAVTVYELTPRGHELEQALLGLARFGLGLVSGTPSADDPPPPDRFGLLLRVLFDPDGAPAQAETWAFDRGDAQLAITVSGDGFRVHPGLDELPQEPSARFIANVPTVYDLLVGRLEPSEALETERLRVEGDQGALLRMRAAFPAPASDAMPAAAG
jgi:DNA-binding HxlR family transcriptional regulator